MDTGLAIAVLSVAGVVVAAILKTPAKTNGYLTKAVFDEHCKGLNKTLGSLEKGQDEIFRRLGGIEGKIK